MRIRPTLRSFTSLVSLLLVLAACAAAQDAPPAEPPAPVPSAKTPAANAPSAAGQGASPASPAAHAAASTEALEALARAARFQRGDTPLPRPTTLHGAFHVSVRDRDGNMLEADAERWYTADPERLLTRRKESVTGSRSSEGFDGGTAWFRDDATGRVMIYSESPETYEVDLERLNEQLRLTRLLLDACVLDALIPRLRELRSGARQSLSDPDGDVHAVQHVLARVPDELFPAPTAKLLDPAVKRELQLDFGIDAESGALWSLRVTALERPDVPPIELRFAFHGATASGLRVPGNIKVFRGDETVESIRLGVAEDDQGKLRFEVDAPIDPALFAVPEH